MPPIAPSAYLRSKGIGEEIIRQSGEDSAALGYFNYLNGPKFVWGRGLHVTSFRPSVIFGNGDSFIRQFASLLGSVPFVIPLAKAQAKLQPVWVEDVVSAFVQAIDDPKTFGKTFDLCGPKVYSLAEILRYTQSLIGKHQVIFPVCDLVANLQAMVFERLPGKILTRDNLLSLSVDNVCSRNDLLHAFGIETTAVESIVPDYIGKNVGRAEQLSAVHKRRASGE